MENRDSARRAEHIGSILRDLMKLPAMEQQDRAHRALLLWDSVVGEELSKHCEAALLLAEQGTMIVEVEHAVWMHSLQMQEETLRERINRQLGHTVIQRIRFRLRPSKPEDTRALLSREGKPDSDRTSG